MFFQVTLAGYTLLALVFILDKIIVTRRSAGMHPVSVAFYSSVPLLLLFLFFLAGVPLPANFTSWLVAFLSGGLLVGALIFLYYGLAQSDVSHNGPVVGIFTTLATLLLAGVVFGEALPIRVLLGILALLVGSGLISYKYSRGHLGWHRGTLFAALSGICFALSNISAKWLYDAIGFDSGFILSYGTAGIVALLLIFHPAVRQALGQSSSARHGHATHGLVAILISDKVLGLGGSWLIRYAISLGSVSVVSALQGFQYALIVILAALLSRLRPGVFRERYRRGELGRELFGVALVAAGLVVML